VAPIGSLEKPLEGGKVLVGGAALLIRLPSLAGLSLRPEFKFAPDDLIFFGFETNPQKVPAIGQNPQNLEGNRLRAFGLPNQIRARRKRPLPRLKSGRRDDPDWFQGAEPLRQREIARAVRAGWLLRRRWKKTLFAIAKEIHRSSPKRKRRGPSTGQPRPSAGRKKKKDVRTGPKGVKLHRPHDWPRSAQGES
jgi:hypothetical protein